MSLVRARLAREFRAWEGSGQTPYQLKVETVRRSGVGVEVLVETGTLNGDMVAFQRPYFRHCYSIELDPDLYERARRRFGRASDVTILHGDSGERLAELAAEITEPSLFWLDAHYSAGATARGTEDSPVRHELRHVLARGLPDVVLMDDAQYFTGRDGYPTIQEVDDLVGRVRPQLKVTVADNIIRIGP